MASKPGAISDIDNNSTQQISKEVHLSDTAHNKAKKPSKKDASDLNFKKQKQISDYFHGNLLSNTKEQSIDPQHAKINQLKQQLNAKQKTLQATRMQKQVIEHRYSKIYKENKDYKLKAKQIIIKTLSEEAYIFRNNRQKVDVKLGYYIKRLQEFVWGSDIVKMKKQLSEKNQQYCKLQSKLKKCKSEQEKQRIKLSKLICQKQIAQKQSQFARKQIQLNIYKVKLKIAQKQKLCTFQNAGWPIVKDEKDNQRYLPLWLLGKGGFGQVYKCYDLQTNEYVALKINLINVNKNDWQNNLKHVEREIKVHQQLKHPNIVQIKQVLQADNQKVVFVLEYCDGPELSLYIKQKKNVAERDAKMIMYQIFSALNYLSEREQKIIHYDLKPSNIMFHEGIVKLLDFGLCKQMDCGDSRMYLTSQGTGTYWYLPPQTFLNSNQIKISPKVDVWSAGVIFYEMLYGKRPFADDYAQATIFQQDLITKFAANFKFPTQTKFKISQETKDFISQCLRPKQQQRLSPKQAFNHPYFKS